MQYLVLATACFTLLLTCECKAENQEQGRVFILLHKHAYVCLKHMRLSFCVSGICADDPAFKDASGAGCTSWKGAVGGKSCSDAEIHRVRENCQKTCNLCLGNESSCSDTDGFLDSKAYTCRGGWQGITCTDEFMRELRDRCPETCGLCLPCDASLWRTFNAVVECKSVGGKPNVLNVIDAGPWSYAARTLHTEVDQTYAISGLFYVPDNWPAFPWCDTSNPYMDHDTMKWCSPGILICPGKGNNPSRFQRH